jgi:hypothetical protein
LGNQPPGGGLAAGFAALAKSQPIPAGSDYFYYVGKSFNPA